MAITKNDKKKEAKEAHSSSAVARMMTRFMRKPALPPYHNPNYDPMSPHVGAPMPAAQLGQSPHGGSRGVMKQ
jgi:hypothetical protein